MSTKKRIQQVIDFIQQKNPGFSATIGLVLGSGLSAITSKITDKVTLNYTDIPGFPKSTVHGHPGQLIMGKIAGVPIVCLEGRIHIYEGKSHDDFKVFIRTLKHLGCEAVIMTNAAGSFHQNVAPGQLMMIQDHINLQRTNPLIGPNDDEYGPRFVSMVDAYDPGLRQLFAQSARELAIDLATGTYLGVSGPVFETPAEVNAFKNLGADAVGMSTIPEVIIARHCGMKVATISLITNLAVGLSDVTVDHELTLKIAKESGDKLERLIIHTILSASKS